jgi:predicted ATP-dependent endonuclease of OLD family
MQIRELTIERFRGINALSWRPPSNVVCLIGKQLTAIREAR